jgi:hypothetical protein
MVSDFGTHDLSDDTVAQVEALKLAESLRETRPHLLGQNYFISVTNETGAGVCVRARWYARRVFIEPVYRRSHHGA